MPDLELGVGPSYSDFPPVRDFMRAMAQDFMPGDRLVIDPLLKGLPSSMEWSYYKSVYFRQGDFRLSENDAAPERRIWYLSRQGSEDPAVSSWARVGRIQTAAWGPWYLHASLLEAPPDELGVRVGEDLRFLGTDVDRRADVHAGDILPIRLWWAADFPTPADFPVRLELYDSSGSLVADVETLPRSPDAPVRQGILNPGDLLMDSRWVEVPYHLDDGMYTLRLTAWPGEGDTLPSSGGSLVIDRFHLASFATW